MTDPIVSSQNERIKSENKLIFTDRFKINTPSYVGAVYYKLLFMTHASNSNADFETFKTV